MPARACSSRVGETIGSNATVKSVFGEPIHAGGRSVEPVAQLSCVFGGGLGSGHGPEAIASAGNMRGEGEGGGEPILPELWKSRGPASVSCRFSALASWPLLASVLSSLGS